MSKNDIVLKLLIRTFTLVCAQAFLDRSTKLSEKRQLIAVSKNDIVLKLLIRTLTLVCAQAFWGCSTKLSGKASSLP